jgi:hypothetical protein
LIVFCGALCWVTYTLSVAQFPKWSPLRLTMLTCIPGAVGLVVANAMALAAGWASRPSAQAIGAVGWQIFYFSGAALVVGALAANNLYLRRASRGR